LKLLTARKAFSNRPLTPEQLIEEETGTKKKGKGEEEDPDKSKDKEKEKEVDFTAAKPTRAPKEYVKEIYLSYDGSKPRLTEFKTAGEALRGIGSSIAQSLASYPDHYLEPLFHTLSSAQLKIFEEKNEEFRNDYDARRRQVVKRFFSTLKSLLQSRRLDGIKKRVLGGYANRHIRLYLNAHPCLFTYYDVLTLKKDALVAQFEPPRSQVEQTEVKTIIVKGLERPKKFLTVTKTKKKNMKKRAKKKWRVAQDDENTSLPAQADLLEEGDEDNNGDEEVGDDEPLNDEEEVEKFNTKAGNKEKEERNKKREEEKKKQLEDIQKMKQENKGQRLSKKEKLLLKQQEKLNKREQRHKRKFERVKEANEKQHKNEGEDAEDDKEGETETQVQEHAERYD